MLSLNRVGHLKVLGLAAVALATLLSSDRAQARSCDELFRTSYREAQNPAARIGGDTFPDRLRALNRVEVVQPVDVKPSEIDAVRGETVAPARRVADVLEKIGRAREVRTVLYPAAGFDAATPFRIFEHADLVIGMDNHPFAVTKRAQERAGVHERWLESGELSEKVNVRGWVKYDQVNKQRSVLRGLTASLLSLSPNVRILSAEALDAYGHVEGRAVVHGIVKFDLGPGTTMRTYVHLHTPTDLTRTTLPPWTPELLAAGYQAVLKKAAMDTYESYTESFGGFLIDHLRSQRGFIVDGDGMLSRWPWWQSREARETFEVRELETEILGLGYQAISIFEFGK